MINPSDIQPDVELRDVLKGQVRVGLAGGGSQIIPVYGDWERPTNEAPSDFIAIYMNGSVEGLSRENGFARGHLIVALHSKMNDDGTVKKARVKKLLKQFEDLVINNATENYFFEYEIPQYITPTIPDRTTGYSVTRLNLKWHTTNNFNSE
jgi:hypothetical protein